MAAATTAATAAGRAAVVYLGGVIQRGEGVGGGQAVGIGEVVAGDKAAGYDIVIDADRDKTSVAAGGSYGAAIHQRSQSGIIVIVVTVHEESLQIIL